jgi:hypothetical protein
MLPLADIPLAAPALPLDEAGKYVAGAYIVFLVLVVIYVAIMAAKLQRIERELHELAGFVETRSDGEKDTSDGAARLDETRPEVDSAPPGRGSEAQSVSVSPAPSESSGGGAL